MAGKVWLRFFVRHKPELSLKRPTSTRAMGFNKPQCDHFFKNLSKLLNKYKFPPHSIYNMMRRGSRRFQTNHQRWFWLKESALSINFQVQIVELIWLCLLPLMLLEIFLFHLYSQSYWRQNYWMGSTLLNRNGADTSYINSNLCLDRVSHLKNHAKSSRGDLIILILDNTSHCTLATVKCFHENHIHALAQPLDRCIFNSLKISYAVECEKLLQGELRQYI